MACVVPGVIEGSCIPRMLAANQQSCQGDPPPSKEAVSVRDQEPVGAIRSELCIRTRLDLASVCYVHATFCYAES